MEINSPENFLRDVLLRDGALLRMRALRQSDREALIALFNRCSPETRRYRFLRMITSLPDSLLDQLVATDGVRHVALVLTQGENDEEKIVAVGRYFALDKHPNVAEVSFLVEDAMQKRGIGTILLDALAEIAREHGITRFAADVLADNRLMMSVFRKAGYALTSNISYGVTHLEFPILCSEVAEARRDAQEAEAERASLSAVFEPKTIAVIGASRDPVSVGGALFRNLLRWGFAGAIYPINPSATSIAGVHAYAGVADLPEAPELAFVAVPAKQVPAAARQCAAVGVRALCVVTAGFAETGEAGKAEQSELLNICRASGMRLVGPNCMGVINTSNKVRLLGTFAPVEPPAGNVAMSSQSGALGLALMARAREAGVGVSSFISVGNKADVSGNDLLQFWEGDEATEVILFYLENFGNPRRFARIARRVSRAKPIVAVKAGRTAGTVGSDRAVDALFAQTGIIRVNTLAEFFPVARLLASQPIPQGKRLGILTNGGGPGIVAVDAAIAAGLEIPVLSEVTQAKLRAALPAAAIVTNPVDVIANPCPANYQTCLEILCDDPDLDALLVIFIPPLATPTREVAQVMSDVLAGRPNLQKTVAAVFFDPFSPSISVPVSEKKGRTNRCVPVYDFPESAVAALGAAARYGIWRAAPTGSLADIKVDRDAAQKIIEADPKGGLLAREAAAALLATAGIEFDAGAEVAPDAVEVKAGITNDTVFGPLVTFGSGGALAELLDDVVFRVLPLTDRDAAEMVQSARIRRRLNEAQLSAIETLLLRLGALAEAVPQIAEIDLNPVTVAGEKLRLRAACVRLN